MIPLNQYSSNSLETERVERKFMMSRGQSYGVPFVLFKFGFKEIYLPRSVSSVYFDDIDFNCLRDNIDGIRIRDKLRVRYYDHDFSTSKIEIKHKRGVVGFKSTFPLYGSFFSEDDVIREAKRWCENNVIECLSPTAYVNYKRRYFEKDGLRATLDTSVSSGRLVGKCRVLSSMQNYEVIELKYPTEMDERVRGIYDKIDKMALRNTKSSKYSNALMY